MAAGDAPITGTRIAAGLKRMSAGTTVAVGPSMLGETFSTLSSSPNTQINFDGASGLLDFNNDSGEAPSDIDIWCVVINGTDTEFRSSGQYYDTASGDIKGTDTCD